MTLKLGRLPVDYSKPRLWAEDYYVTSALPIPPQNVDRCSRVSNWPMYLNDRFGCCTISGFAHTLGAQTMYAKGSELLFSDSEIETSYEAVCPGFDPRTDANDNGATLQGVLTNAKANGFGGLPAAQSLSAFAQLRSMSEASLKLALYLFGSVYIGVALPKSAEQQFGAGQPWTYEKGSPIIGGHCVVIQKVTPGFTNPYTVITWGAAQRVQDLWLQTYMEEAWVVVTPEWMQSNMHTIDGLNLVQLEDDMNAI